MVGDFDVCSSLRLYIPQESTGLRKQQMQITGVCSQTMEMILICQQLHFGFKQNHIGLNHSGLVSWNCSLCSEDFFQILERLVLYATLKIEYYLLVARRVCCS